MKNNEGPVLAKTTRIIKTFFKHINAMPLVATIIKSLLIKKL